MNSKEEKVESEHLNEEDNDLNVWAYENALPASILKLLGNSFRPPNNANVGVSTVVGGRDDDKEHGIFVGGNHCSSAPLVGWLPSHNLT